VIEGLKQVAKREKPQADDVPKEVEKPAAKVNTEPKGAVIVKDALAPPNVDIPANPFADAPPDVAKEKLAVANDNGALNVNVAPKVAISGLNYAIIAALLVALFWVGPVAEAVASPISGLIYAFALWEAWKMNRPVRLSFNGPFRVSAQGSSESEPQVDDNGG
jgi:hypothetical protein